MLYTKCSRKNVHARDEDYLSTTIYIHMNEDIRIEKSYINGKYSEIYKLASIQKFKRIIHCGDNTKRNLFLFYLFFLKFGTRLHL